MTLPKGSGDDRMEMNEEFRGFIHDKLDIGILILYALDRLPYEINKEALSELVMFDGGFSWFEFSDALDSLVHSEQVIEKNNNYIITDNGRRNVGYVGHDLPYSVRLKADELVSIASAEMERARQIDILTAEKGDLISVRMKLNDGVGEVMTLQLTVPDKKTAEKIAGHMRKNAEFLYQSILTMLLEE